MPPPSQNQNTRKAIYVRSLDDFFFLSFLGFFSLLRFLLFFFFFFLWSCRRWSLLLSSLESLLNTKSRGANRCSVLASLLNASPDSNHTRGMANLAQLHQTHLSACCHTPPDAAAETLRGPIDLGRSPPWP